MTTAKLRPPPAATATAIATAFLPAATIHDDETFYPETDGEPLPDGQHQAPLYREIVSTLEAHFRSRPNTSVNGNTFIYYEQGNPRRHVSPDCYVAFNVDVPAILARNAYRMWEVGKAPDFALEIASETTATEDTGHKVSLYAVIGFGELWLYDATGGAFYGFALEGRYLGADGAYHPVRMRREADGMIWGHSRALGLDLCWVEGRLRFYDPARGEWLRNFEETIAELGTERSARASAEAQLAELETERTARADAEAQLGAERTVRANAEARVAELEAELRRLQGAAD